MSKRLEKDESTPMLAAKLKPKRSQFAFVTRYILLALMACIAIALLLAPKPWEHPQLGKSEDLSGSIPGGQGSSISCLWLAWR